jgi:hypothetical protein
MAAGCWLLAAGCWLLAAGCWLLAARLLAARLLAAGCWLLAACRPPMPGWQGRAPMVTATERSQTIFIFYDINRAWSPSRYQFES